MRHLFTDRRGNPIFESFTQRRLRRLFHRQESTPLVSAVKNRHWDELVRRCQSHPHELTFREEATGNTPMHMACRLNPPAGVIRAMKGLARVANNEGATPLHYAASHRMAPEALVALLDVGKAGGSASTTAPVADLSHHGRAPVHYACASFRGLELDAFKILLEETIRSGFVEVDSNATSALDEEEDFLDDLEEDYYQPSGGKKPVNVLEMKDLTGQTPLGLLFRRYRERVRHVINRVDRLHRRHEPQRAALAAALTVQGDLGGLWDKARWIVARLSEERTQREEQMESEFSESLDPQSPGELAVAHEAAQWALEQHGVRPPSIVLASTGHMLPPLRSLPPTNEEAVAAPPSSGEESEASIPPRRPRRKFRIVHCSVGLIGYGCPPEMIRLALSLHPAQVREMDEDGNLPIHIAAIASANLVEAQPSATTMAHALAAAAGGADDLSVLSDAALSFFSVATVRHTTNPLDKVLKMLLQHYPDGAKIPQGKTGRLPLVMAIESGHRTWQDGIRTLLNAYPPAMHKKKLIGAELYPHLLGLVVGPATFVDGLPINPKSPTRSQQQAVARTTLFDLLRTKPDWLTREHEEKSSVARATPQLARLPTALCT
jgi:hypothetical protein